MIVIGERINGMFSDVKKGIQERDKEVIQKLALGQMNAGADYLDVNVGPAVPSAQKGDAMVWLVETIQEATDAPICVDSPRLSDIQAALEVIKNPAMINSTQADPEQLETYVKMAVENDASLIALTMDKSGVPQDTDKRIELASNIVVAAMEAGLPFDKLFIDPIVLPVKAVQRQAQLVLEALGQLKLLADPPPHFVVGLSNISQGAKERDIINRTYVVMCVAAGLDAAIADPFDTEFMDAVITAELLMSKQIYSDSFITAYHSSKRIR